MAVKNLKQQELEELQAVEDMQQKVETVEDSKDEFELFRESTELAIRMHRPVAIAFQNIVNVIPPLKLVMTAGISVWDIMHATFWDKKSSTLSKSAKVGLSATVIAVAIAAIVVPPIAGALLVTIAGLALGKEFLNLGSSLSSYLETKKLLQNSSPEEKITLGKLLREHRNDVIKKGASVALAAISLAGFALLVTPLAPVGLGLLIGAAVVGIGIAAGPYIAKKAASGIKLLKSKLKSFFSKDAAEETETLSEGETKKDTQGYAHVSERLEGKNAKDILRDLSHPATKDQNHVKEERDDFYGEKGKKVIEIKEQDPIDISDDEEGDNDTFSRK